MPIYRKYLKYLNLTLEKLLTVKYILRGDLMFWQNILVIIMLDLRFLTVLNPFISEVHTWSEDFEQSSSQ